MTPADLGPVLSALNQLALFNVISVTLMAFLVLVELIRLVIVIKRSVKGRMDHVR